MISTQVQNDGLGLEVKALCDTGADIPLLVSPAVADRAIEVLGARMVRLCKPIQLADYRKQLAGRITHKVVMNLELDHRRFRDQTFFVTDTGHDVFIGQEWLAKQDVWIHPGTRSFKWPDDKPPLAKFSPVLKVDHRKPRPDPKAQADTQRRDALMEQEDRKLEIRRILKRPLPSRDSPRVTFEPQLSVSIAALHAQIEADPRQARWRRQAMPTTAIPLEFGGATGPSTEIRAATRHESWRTHTGKKIPFPSDEDQAHVQKVRDKLPSRLAHLEGFFSKKASTRLPPSRPGHDVTLELARPLKGSPPSFRTPLSFMSLEKETVDELLRIGFIEPCMDDNAASVLFAPKPHSTERRFCIDYRWINQFIANRQVLAPDVNGTISNCRNAQRMTKVDIIKAFHRLRIEEGSKYLTAFKTRQGTFRWNVLPFGLKVGPAWWQSFINAQLNELLDLFASAYADDVLVYTDEYDEETHWDQVEEVIYRLDRADLQGDIDKSRFGVTTIDYLGMVLEVGKGVRIDPEKIEAITSWKFEDLANKTALRSFLGLCNYVRVFCYHSSELAEPLTRLLKKDVSFALGPEQRQAFEALKKLAVEAPVLAFFVPGRPTKVETDASRNATGGVIWQQQPEDKQWKPVGYFSKTMTATERAYPIQDRELLAVVQTLERYEPELLGTKFFVVTDHQALLYWSSKRLLSTRQVRWADFLANFDITFQYRRGVENVVADALSRKTVDTPTVKAREQEDRTFALIDPGRVERKVAAVEPDRETEPLTGADLVDLIRQENERQGLGRHEDMLVVPDTTSDGRIFLRTALIREAHTPKAFAHAGQNKVIQFLRDKYWWQGRNKDIRTYVKNCHDCGRNKVRHDKTPGLLHPLPIPNRVWEQVVVDGKDMPKDERGYDYVWVFVCKFSRLIARLPGNKTDTAEKLAKRSITTCSVFWAFPSSG